MGRLCGLKIVDVFNRNHRPQHFVSICAGRFAGDLICAGTAFNRIPNHEIQLSKAEPLSRHVNIGRGELRFQYGGGCIIGNQTAFTRPKNQIFPFGRIRKALIQHIFQHNIRHFQFQRGRGKRIIDNGTFPFVHVVPNMIKQTVHDIVKGKFFKHQAVTSLSESILPKFV